MAKVGFYLFSLLFFLNTSLLAYSSDPKDFIYELVDDSIKKLSDKNLNESEKYDASQIYEYMRPSVVFIVSQ